MYKYLTKEYSIFTLDKKNKRNIFNLGSGTCYSMMEIINHCFNIAKIKPKINVLNVIKRRKYDIDSLLCNISKAKKILSWKSKYFNLKKIISDKIWWFKFLKKINLIEN